MAKQSKKPAKRVFFVRRNIDDISALRNITTNPKDLLDFYEGEFFGSAGAPEEACNGKSRAFVHGWEMGNEAHLDARESFEKAREAGRKSAEAREAKQGTAQPKGGKGFGTRNRTSDRTTFGKSELGSERPSDNGGPDDDFEEDDPSAPWNWRPGTELKSERPSDPSEHTSELGSEPSSTQHPVASSDDGGLKRTLSPKRACAHAKDEQQEGLSEDPDEIEDFHSRRRPIHELPRRGYRPGMQTGASA